MINQEKVKDMAKLAMYERHGGEKELATSAYRRRDYVALQMMKSFVLGTISYVLILVLIVLGLPDIMDALHSIESIFALANKVGIGYVIFLALLFVFTFIWARKRHNRSVENTKEYQVMLSRVARSYQTPQEQETETDDLTI